MAAIQAQQSSGDMADIPTLYQREESLAQRVQETYEEVGYIAYQIVTGQFLYRAVAVCLAVIDSRQH